MQLSVESHLIVVLVTAAVVSMVIVFHFETIKFLNRWFRTRDRKLRSELRNSQTLLATIFILLFAHVAEIWMFGAAFWYLLSQGEYGAISGYAIISFLDCVYFSAANFATVGWGDLAATGQIRFLAGTEALVGFMMITWSASYSYLLMARTWGQSAD